MRPLDSFVYDHRVTRTRASKAATSAGDNLCRRVQSWTLSPGGQRPFPFIRVWGGGGEWVAAWVWGCIFLCTAWQSALAWQSAWAWLSE